jgi:uncharacterized protein (TIGR00106 family)
MAVVEVSIIPLGVPGTSLSGHVAGVLRVLQESSLHYELTAMGTIIEGDLADLMDILKKMHETPFNKGANRVYSVIKIDDRRDCPAGIEKKVKSVENKL